MYIYVDWFVFVFFGYFGDYFFIFNVVKNDNEEKDFLSYFMFIYYYKKKSWYLGKKFKVSYIN